jgi:hypothetical protein
MGRIGTTLPLLPLLTGCPCPSLEEAQVWDPHDAISEEQAWAIRDTMLDFADWTGVSDLCVLGVKVRPILWPNAGGMYQGDGEWILVQARDKDNYTRTVHHELCHAWDYTMGWPSHDNPEVFQVEDTERVLNYWTDERRIRESFANACEKGPYELGIERGIEASCELELIGRRQRWIMDQVYVHYRERWPHAGSTTFSYDATPLEGFTWLRELVVADGQLLASTKTSSDRNVAYWSAAPWQVHDQPSSELPTGNRYHVRSLDPETGEERWNVEITDKFPPFHAEVHLLGGQGGPVLVVMGGAETRGWRLDLDTLTWSEQVLPDLWLNLEGGVALEDRVLLLGTPAGELERQLMEVDPTDGSWQSHSLSFGWSNLLGWNEFQALDGEVLFGLNDGPTTTLFRYRPGYGIVERTPISSNEWTFFASLQQLPDERLLMALALPSDPDLTSFRTFGMLAEPDGSWRLDEAGCDPGTSEPLGFASGWATNVLSVDDQLVYVRASLNEDGEYEWWLVHLGVSD